MARDPDHIIAWRRAALAGDVAAQFQLGDAYRTGADIPRDHTEALRWLHKAATSGHAQAGRILQQMQARGLDITPPPEDTAPRRHGIDELLDALKPAAGREGDGGMDAPLQAPAPDADSLDLEGGTPVSPDLERSDDPAAWVHLGNSLRLSGDDVGAVDWYMKAAKAGNTAGQYALAVMYDQGLGIRANDSQALHWYLAAAKAGDAQAQYNLANMIRAGRGCPPDAKVAEQWYKKAAAQGEGAALFSLGALYESGQGGAADPAKAEDFYRQAAAKGVAEAQFNLGNMLRRRDLDAALDFYTQASEQGLRQAQLNLGLLLQDSDAAQAAYWLRRAARAGDTIAMLNLAALLITGRGVLKDEAEALLWLQHALRLGHGQVAEIAGKGVTVLSKAMGAEAVARAQARALFLGLGDAP